jgi:hypothetical protein
VQSKQSRETALERYDRFHEAHRWKFETLLRFQRLVPRIHPRLLAPAFGVLSRKRVSDWAFEHYLRIAPPAFAGLPPGGAGTLRRWPRTPSIDAISALET